MRVPYPLGRTIRPRLSTVLTASLTSFLLAAQTGPLQDYLIHLDGDLTGTAGKQLWETLTEPGQVERMAMDVEQRSVKLSTRAPLLRGDVEHALSHTGITLLAMIQVATGEVIGPDLRPVVPLELRDQNAGMGTRDAQDRALKEQWLTQHPQWRRDHPARNQIPHLEE